MRDVKMHCKCGQRHCSSCPCLCSCSLSRLLRCCSCCCAFNVHVTVEDHRNSCVVELIWHNRSCALSPPCVSTGFHADTALVLQLGLRPWQHASPVLMARSGALVVSAIPALMARSSSFVVSAAPALMAGSREIVVSAIPALTAGSGKIVVSAVPALMAG